MAATPKFRSVRWCLGLVLACLALGSALGAEPPARAAEPLPELGSPRPLNRDFEADMAARKTAGKSYSIPAMEIIGFDTLLNLYDRAVYGDDYRTSLSSIHRNLRSSWVIDQDPFLVNQLGHPYQGSMYHGFARSAGLNYWESLGYTVAGSAMWEIAGEATPPSRNDQITTGFGGSFLGEALFRTAHLVLERGGNLSPFWKEVGAAIISPSLGFNRLAFGDRFKNNFSSGDPAYYGRLQLGFSGTAQNNSGTSTTRLKRNEALTDFSLEYGLPGKPGYNYTRPFDYFTFQATASSANGFENLMTRGLLLGRDYAVGQRYRGIWGLYGSYDYIEPQTFRVSSTAVSLGSTAQWALSNSLTLQGSALAGLGYTAVGSVAGVAEDREFHYGVAPQLLLALRLIMSERASLDVTARSYYVSRVAAADRGGHETVARLDASFTVRVSGPHAIAIKYLGNRRDAVYPDLGDRSQSRGTIGIFYTLLGREGFGTVDTRGIH